MELTHEVASPDNPHVLGSGRIDHLGVDLGHVRRRETDLYRRHEVTVCEDPGGCLLHEVRLVVEEPLPRRCAHRGRAHSWLEGLVTHVGVARDVAGHEPVEGVVGRRDEAVEGAAGVVDRRHRSTMAPCTDNG